MVILEGAGPPSFLGGIYEQKAATNNVLSLGVAQSFGLYCIACPDHGYQPCLFLVSMYNVCIVENDAGNSIKVSYVSRGNVDITITGAPTQRVFVGRIFECS